MVNKYKLLGSTGTVQFRKTNQLLKVEQRGASLSWYRGDDLNPPF